ncbi:MAG: hypothetical protein Q9220_002635 [cf. Caloplaca sp. 1 TL-2023]
MTEKIEGIFRTADKLDNQPEWNAVEVHEDELVEEKYQGNAVDRQEMRMLGRIQVLRRNFSFVPLLGFSTVLICTWELLFAYASDPELAKDVSLLIDHAQQLVVRPDRWRNRRTLLGLHCHHLCKHFHLLELS